MANILLEPTASELAEERDRLLGETRLSEGELRERAEHGELSAAERRVLHRLDEIDYLLGADD